MAKKIKSPENSKILLKIAREEIRHYSEWKNYTHREVKPSRIKIALYYWTSRIFGFTFGVKLMERGEKEAQQEYDHLLKTIPEMKSILHDENEHEDALLAMLDEEHLRYTGSIIFTVALLVLPFLIVDNYYLCIGFTLAAAVFIIAFFNYYLAVVQGTNFKKRFFEMTGVSFGVAGLSFGIGLLVRFFLNVDI